MFLVGGVQVSLVLFLQSDNVPFTGIFDNVHLHLTWLLTFFGLHLPSCYLLPICSICFLFPFSLFFFLLFIIFTFYFISFVDLLAIILLFYDYISVYTMHLWLITVYLQVILYHFIYRIKILQYCGSIFLLSSFMLWLSYILLIHML